ncbi:MAG: hypothetical protein QM753_19720 [Thermomicrobiales bacterium]
MTIAFALIAPVASWVAVLLAVFPEASIPLWMRGVLLVPRLLMIFSGIWLFDSVRRGHRLSIVSLVSAIGVAGAVVLGLPDLDRTVQAELALSVLLPSVVLVLMTHHLIRLRRSAMLKPLF